MLVLTPLVAHAGELVRVDDPDWPDAIARSATGATIAGPPPPGTPWRYEAIPVPDRLVDSDPRARTVWPALDALEVTNADLWHAQGITGAGVKVAVFDSGFYAGDLDLAELGRFETHDCQLSISCEPVLEMAAPSFSRDEGHHGIACAEIVRDLAPDAELHLVKVNSYTTFENGVAWAVREGIDVISMSMSFYTQSFYDGTGPFDAQLEVLERAGILLVSSAGNNAATHWSGDWKDGDLDHRHDGPDADNGIYVYDAGLTPAFTLSWNQYARCGDTDLDFYAYDLAGRRLGLSEDVQRAANDRCEPVEELVAAPSSDGWYRLEVVARRGTTANLRIDVLPKDMSMWKGSAEGSVADPGSNPLTFAVGAVRADGYLANPIEPYSSRGPTHAGLPKPDISGPDGLSGTVYGGAGFFGTSASTPAVAALIALVKSQDRTLTSRAAAQRLQGWAYGEPAMLPDNVFGAGKARLPVLDAGPQPCGRRPLILPILVVPVAWWSRRRTPVA